MPAPIIPSASAQTQSAKENESADDEQDWQGLPPGKGREETFYMCSPCHSLKLVIQQGLSKKRWDEVMDWMFEEQEMPELEPEDRKLIVDYLAKFYGEDRKARGGRIRRP
ncbi:MAG: cytochrome C-552 [Rhodospirillales bacterium]|nr:cytochrome C-552 [Rhodospirillales bacterium]